MDPFLALRIRGQAPADAETLSRLRGFLDAVYEAYREQLFGSRQILGRMKELWAYPSRLFADGPGVLRSIQRAQSLEEYEGIVDRFFDRGRA
jgi:hypothetical protein